MNRMDHGPFVSWTIGHPALTYKGIAVRVSADPPAVLCFDSDLMRVSAAWTGGMLKWYPQRDGLERNPTPDGALQFSNDAGPGWTARGSFADPRPQPYGPLPRDWARYRGLYRHGDEVVLSYSVGETAVLEKPGAAQLEGKIVFSRAFHFDAVKTPLALRICKMPNSESALTVTNTPQGAAICRIVAGESVRYAGSSPLPAGAGWEAIDQHLCLKLSPHAGPVRFVVWIGGESQQADDRDRGASFAAALSKQTAPDVMAYCRPGPSRWLPALTTTGVNGASDGAFAVDTITLPEQNPWNSWIRPTGFDFLPDGRAVVASVSGDLWLVSGIAEPLGALTWKRFATGLYQPLGVKVVDGQIYVTCRDQIHRLHDLNADGEADFYENFNNDTLVQENFHEYAMNLETDSQGNFYFAKGAPWPPNVKTRHAGVIFKLSKDGQRLETFATGTRGANGLTVGPNDLITFSENEGHWLPTCCVHIAKPGGFYGMKPTAHRSPVPDDFEKPLCWIPHAVDNSPGGQVWVPDGSWGPLAGRMLLTSYGKSTLSLVLMETIGGQTQGGIVQLPLKFQSGLIRGRFKGDHLYLCGLRVWQSNGTKYGAFHRVRYTGKPMHLPVELHATHGGIEIAFSCELDPTSSQDPQDFSVQVWNYRWIQRYGSPHYSARNPEREGQDELAVKSARLSRNRKNVFLEIPDLQPVMQMRLAYNIRAADGTELAHTIYNTIHKLR